MLSGRKHPLQASIVVVLYKFMTTVTLTLQLTTSLSAVICTNCASTVSLIGCGGETTTGSTLPDSPWLQTDPSCFISSDNSSQLDDLFWANDDRISYNILFRLLETVFSNSDTCTTSGMPGVAKWYEKKLNFRLMTLSQSKLHVLSNASNALSPGTHPRPCNGTYDAPI